MKNLKIENTFSDILISEKEKNINITKVIVEGLSQKGIEISPRTIQKYKQGSLIPQYQIAKEIFKILKINISESELLSILELSINQRENNKISNVRKVANPNIVDLDYQPTLRKRIAIRYDQFSFLDDSDVSKEYAIELIEDHVSEIYGDDKYAFNRYIKDLIDKDMSLNEIK